MPLNYSILGYYYAIRYCQFTTSCTLPVFIPFYPLLFFLTLYLLQTIMLIYNVSCKFGHPSQSGNFHRVQTWRELPGPFLQGSLSVLKQTKAMLSTLDAASRTLHNKLPTTDRARALFLTHFKHSLGGGRLMCRTFFCFIWQYFELTVLNSII